MGWGGSCVSSCYLHLFSSSFFFSFFFFLGGGSVFSFLYMFQHFLFFPLPVHAFVTDLYPPPTSCVLCFHITGPTGTKRRAEERSV